YHHIRRLYLEKLTGTISEEENFELGQLLQTDVEAQRAWDSLEKERRDLDADMILARIDPEQELEEWKRRLADEGKDDATPSWGSWWKWAAVVAFAVGSGYFLPDLLSWRDRPGSEIAVADQDLRQTAEVKLMLADGNSVTFS